MNTNNKYGLFAIIAFLLVIIVFLPARSSSLIVQVESPLPTPTPVFEPFPDGEKIALEYASSVFSLPIEELHIGGQVIVQYPVTNKSVWQATIASNDGNQSAIVTIDVLTKLIVDVTDIQRAEELATTEKYGKLGFTLYDYLQNAKADELIPISIWYIIEIDPIRQGIIDKYPEAKLFGHQPGPETDLDLYDKIFAEIVEAERKAYQERAITVISQLEQQGIKAESTVSLAPIIHAECTKEQILRLAESENISSIHLNGKLRLLLNSTATTDRASAVWARGITGANVKVAVVEPDGIYFAHSYLADGVYYNPSSPNVGDHATQMAGIIASTHPTYRGIAYGAPALYSANHGSASYTAAEAAVSAAVTANSNILNLSQGADSGGLIDDFTKFMDHMVYQYLRTVVSGSGNDFISTNSVMNPSLGYNVIGVGGITDFDTSSWSDDQIWVFLSLFDIGSRWKNPVGGREKPEVVADAGTVTSTDINNGFSTPCSFFQVFCAAGTSAATAQVSGVAALLMERNPILKSWPQTVKSVIMASAVNNVEISNNEGGNPIVSDKDGIGGINAVLGDTILQNNWFINDLMPSGSSSNMKSYDVNVVAGERVRVVLSWLSHTSLGSPRTDVLQTNLDLRIEDKDGIIVVDSLSTVDNFEAAEFVAAKSGAYKFRVLRPLGSSVNENFSLAWSKQATYLPDIRRNTTDGWTSLIYVRNDGSEPRDVKVTFLNANGSYNSALNVPLNTNMLWPSIFSPNNWQGSAIVDGNEDLSVVVLQERSSPYTHETYAGVGNPATDVLVPIVQKNNSGFFSDLFIMNAGGATTDITTQFLPAPGYGSSASTSPSSLAPGAVLKISTNSLSISIGNSAGVFVGSARVTNSAGQRLAIASSQYRTSSGSQMLETSNTQSPAVVLYAPLIQYINQGWQSGLALSSYVTPPNFYVRYNPIGSTQCFQEVPPPASTPEPNPRVIFPAPSGAGCPTNPIARFQSNGAMTANVNQILGTTQATTYAAIAMPSTTVNIAKVQRDSNTGWSDGFVIANFNPYAVAVTARIYNADGLESVYSPVYNATLGAGQSVTILGQIPNGFNGSAIVNASAPVAVSVNSLKSGSGDTIGSYPGNHR
ncbi:MAG: S8 family peptidase [Caldilineaceae bacterium]